MTEDEMIGWHHQLNGREFEQVPADSEGQGSLASCSPWGLKESDTSEQLNNNPGTRSIVNHRDACSIHLCWEKQTVERLPLGDKQSRRPGQREVQTEERRPGRFSPR